MIGYLENWADMVIVRYKDLSLIEYMAEHSYIPIINAMTAVNHPCEILTDLYPFQRNMWITRKRNVFYGFKGEYWKYMERGIGISGIQFYTVLS